MEESLKTNSLTFQFISLYDRTIFHFIERVTQHLRESIYILNDERLNGIKESLTLGDLIPEKYLSKKSNWYIYQIDQNKNVEDIILQVNKDIFGDNLTDIPDSEIDVVVKFVYNFKLETELLN
jgi:hypothetical protein